MDKFLFLHMNFDILPIFYLKSEMLKYIFVI